MQFYYSPTNSILNKLARVEGHVAHTGSHSALFEIAMSRMCKSTPLCHLSYAKHYLNETGVGHLNNLRLKTLLQVSKNVVQ